MAYGQAHTATIPTVGSTPGEDFATDINAVLAEMRTTLDAKVTPAGIDVNSDLSMRSGATRYGITNAHRVAFYQQPALLDAATYPAALYASSGGELYFNDASGNQVALTSGGSIAGSPGSITGSGYGSGGVELNWDSGAADYHFYSAASTYADAAMRDLLLNDGDANFIRLEAPALVADYTLTLPAAVPASTSLLTMSSAGAVATSRDLTFDTLTLTGAASVGGNLTLTGSLKHGERTLCVQAIAGSVVSGSATRGRNGYTAASIACEVMIPFQIELGKRIKGVTVYGNDSSGASFHRSELIRVRVSGGAVARTQLGTDIDTGNVFTGVAGQAMSPGITTTVATGDSFYVLWTSGAVGDEVHSIEITYDEV